MPYNHCLGVVRVNRMFKEVTCSQRDNCVYYPRNIRWLADNYPKCDTFGGSEFIELHPTDQPCPWFLPRDKGRVKTKVKTPFD